MTLNYVDAARTDALVLEAHGYISAQLALYGNGVPIPDFKNSVLRFMMGRPVWDLAWIDWPTHCKDSTDTYETHGLWGCIEARYPLFNPGFAIAAVRHPRTKRLSGEWIITSSLDAVLPKMAQTITDNRARSYKDERSVRNMAAATSEALGETFIAAPAAGDRITAEMINASIRISDDLRILTAPQLRARYGWGNRMDAIRTYQTLSGTMVPETMEIGEMFWDEYAAIPGLP